MIPFPGMPPPTDQGTQIMVPSAKNQPAKNVIPAWLIFCVLGLTATLCGLFLPQCLRPLREPSLTVPASQPTPQKPDSLEYSPPALTELPNPGAMFLRLTLGTAFVLFLCVVILWAGKRWVRPLSAPMDENRRLRVLESLPLAGRCSMFLLQAGEAKVLVGVDQTGIKAMLPLPQPFENALAESENQFTMEATENTERKNFSHEAVI